MKRRNLTLFFILIATLCSSQELKRVCKTWEIKGYTSNKTSEKSSGSYLKFYSNKTFELGKIEEGMEFLGEWNYNKADKSLTLNCEKNTLINGQYHIKKLKEKQLILQRDTLEIYLEHHKTQNTPIKQNSKKSVQKERKGWEKFRNKEFQSAYNDFKTSTLLDSCNGYAYIGLVYSYAGYNGNIDINILKLATKLTKEPTYDLLMTATLIVSTYSPIADSSFQTPISLNKIASYYMGDSFITYWPNGNIQEKGLYKNRRPSGLWISNRNDGTITKSTFFIDTVNIKKYTTYTVDGKKIREDWVEFVEYQESTIKVILYYQELPDKPGKYLFVSKEGFCIYNKEFPVILDSLTPDNYIEEAPETGTVWYIWKNGEKIIYLGPLDE